MVGMFVSLCLASKKPSEREFFGLAGTDLAVKIVSPPLPFNPNNTPPSVRAPLPPTFIRRRVMHVLPGGGWRGGATAMRWRGGERRDGNNDDDDDNDAAIWKDTAMRAI